MVDAVNNNNNRNAVLTTAGAGVGLAAGAGYGAWLSKPLLDGDAPSDAFVRRYYDNDAKTGIAKAAEEAKKTLTESPTYKAAGDDVVKLSALIKDNAKDFGLKAELDADGKVTKSLDDVIKDFVGKDADAAKLKSKMEKAVADTASKAATEATKDSRKLAAIAKEVEALTDKADDLKAFVTKHAETLGIKADDIETTVQKGADEIKRLAKTAAEPYTNKKATLLAQFVEGDIKKGMIKADDVEAAAKPAWEAVKKAARDTKLWAGAKWAAGAGAVLGLATYIGAKMTAPKAEATQDEQA